MTATVAERAPWLNHLRRDRRGICVPWINAWGGEDLARARIVWDRHIPGWALTMDDDPDGAPDFTRQHMGRQRQAVLEGLCQVCARPVPWSRRRLVLAALSMEVVTVNGGGRVPVVTEPWLCQRCAEFAVTVCPALIRRTREEELHIVTVTSKRQVRIVTSVGYVDGPLEARCRELRTVMWAKIQVLNVAAVPR
jgi:hypothetical protein